MKTVHEIKMEAKHGDSLIDHIRENPGSKECEKPSHNILQATQIIPPGRHFFYFIYDRKSIFLSPTYSIVRFKDTSVFLNEIVVEQRESELKRVTLERKIDNVETGEFKRERSVFKTYQEDCDDLVKAMVATDVKFSKILRLTR